MNLLDLQLIRPSHGTKPDVRVGMYYAVQKANEPARIFHCLSSNELHVKGEGADDMHGQYECFEIDVDYIEMAQALRNKCEEDYVAWKNRYGVGNHGVVDLSVLATKFKMKK